uniref:OFCC1 n=2 Tax=Equus caballus TaxID=9796 RepID=A0A5F5Q3H9_HORSE
MDREKFQQKALKQTKQKKSKSAEFLMVKEGREATEGIGNPGFNMSSPDLSAYQPSEKKVIRNDMLDRILAARQQKFRLLASAEPKGNEYSRNYFDPLMDEEINPRQCGMEVSREAPLQVDNRILYDRLMKLFDENAQREPPDDSVEQETLGSEEPMRSSKSPELHKEDGEAASASSEDFERHAQKDVILPGSSSSEQDLKFEGEGLSQYIPMSCLKTDKTFEKAPHRPLIADLNVCEEDSVAKLCTLTEGTHESKKAAGPRWKVGLL